MPKTTHDIVRHGWIKYICVFSSFQAQTHVQQDNCIVVRSSSEGKQNVPLHQRSAVAYPGNPATSPWAVGTAGALGTCWPPSDWCDHCGHWSPQHRGTCTAPRLTFCVIRSPTRKQWVSTYYADGLTTRSREVSEPWNWMVTLKCRSET